MLPYIAWPAGFNVAPAKVSGYLLNTEGNSPAKARWWLSHGYSAERPDAVIDCLFEHTSAANFVGVRIPPRLWGHRLVFKGAILTPIGTTPRIRSVWQVSHGTPQGDAGIATLVTAHRI